MAAIFSVATDDVQGGYEVKAVVFGLLIVVVALLSLGASVLFRRFLLVPVRAAGHLYTPYVLRAENFGSTPGKAPVLTEKRLRAVRRDGAFVEQSVRYVRSGSRSEREFGLPGGITILTNDELHIMTAMQVPDLDSARERQRWDPSQSCALSVGGNQPPQPSHIETDSLLGYAAFKLVVDHPGLRLSIWRAPVLDCAELRLVFEKKNPQTGEVLVTADRTATEVIVGDPDPILFQVPGNFRNLSPTERARETALACCNHKLTAQELALLQPKDILFQKYRISEVP